VKDARNARDVRSLAVLDWLDHDAWWPAFDDLVVAEVQGNVPDGTGAWLVVEDQVAALPVTVGDVHELLASPKVPGIPFVTRVSVVDGTNWCWVDATSVERLHDQAGAIRAIDGHRGGTD